MRTRDYACAMIQLFRRNQQPEDYVVVRALGDKILTFKDPIKGSYLRTGRKRNMTRGFWKIPLRTVPYGNLQNMLQVK